MQFDTISEEQDANIKSPSHANNQIQEYSEHSKPRTTPSKGVVTPDENPKEGRADEQMEERRGNKWEGEKKAVSHNNSKKKTQLSTSASSNTEHISS
jgi:hypothetical protein